MTTAARARRGVEDVSAASRTSRRSMAALDRHGLPGRRRTGNGAVPGRPAAAAHPARGRGGSRQDGGREALRGLLDTPLYRLQCYEGIDAGEALYEWNHQRQLLGIRLAEVRGTEVTRERDFFAREYLLRRPLLQALEHPGPRPAVLLLDEIDRADAEFEAFTFELLAESAVTIPELGTIRATHPPIVILTSNRTRDLHDALTRRCLYHWIDYPGPSVSRARSCAAACPGPPST